MVVVGFFNMFIFFVLLLPATLSLSKIELVEVFGQQLSPCVYLCVCAAR
jgi:hypothetical protein